MEPADSSQPILVNVKSVAKPAQRRVGTLARRAPVTLHPRARSRDGLYGMNPPHLTRCAGLSSPIADGDGRGERLVTKKARLGCQPGFHTLERETGVEPARARISNMAMSHVFPSNSPIFLEIVHSPRVPVIPPESPRFAPGLGDILETAPGPWSDDGQSDTAWEAHP